MKELFDLFDEIGLPYFRQGSMSNVEYPSSFFTFWNIDTPNDSFYDNKETRYIEYIQVGFYTNDPNLIYSQMNDFINRAKQKGFIVQGKARDTNADQDNYFGRLVYLRIVHKEE